MEKDKHKTKVLFVHPKYPDGQREILAIFPEHNERDIRLVGCYAHVGQHSTCDINFMNRVKATPEQYTPLANELERIGYNLDILNKKGN